jgi:hypothetical protein
VSICISCHVYLFSMLTACNLVNMKLDSGKLELHLTIGVAGATALEDRNNFLGAIANLHNPGYATVSDTSGPHVSLNHQGHIQD